MEKFRLHVGGMQVKEGWKILNIQEAPGVDFVGNCVDLSQFENDSIDELYASHVYEHLGYLYELPAALREVHRVLKSDGVLYISVPDFEKLCRLFLDPKCTIDDRFQILRMTFGGQVDQHDFHKAALTMEFLQHLLAKLGFSSARRVEEFGMFQDTSSGRFHGELISLNVIATK